MPEIRSIEELLEHLGDVIASEDPVEALAARGYPLSAELQRRMAEIDKSKRLPPPEIKRFARRIAGFGPTRYVLADDKPDVVTRLEPGDYDLILGAGMDLIAATLAGLHATRVIPAEISTAGAPDLVIDLVRSTFSGVPEGDFARVGSLHFTAPPTPTAVDGTDRVILHQPFELDIVRSFGVRFGGRTEVRIASLRGTLRLTLAVKTDVDPNPLDPTLSIKLESIGFLEDPTPDEEFRIEVAPGSQLQPVSESKLKSFATLVGLFVDREIDRRLGPFEVCPVVKLPFVPGGVLRILGVDVRAVSNDFSGALMIGIRVGGPPNQPGDPERLVNSFADGASNFYARAHVELMRKIISQALESGELTREARKENDDARITGANVEFGDDQIRIKLEGKLVDACGFRKDLKFDAKRIIRFEFLGERIKISQETEKSVDIGDAFLCALTTLLEAATIGVVVGVATAFTLSAGALAVGIGIAASIVDLATTPFVELLVEELVDALKGGGGGPDVSWFALRDPVPSTELLPQIGGISMRSNEESLEQFLRIVLVPDDINTYVYAQFLRRAPFPFQPSSPLAGAEVELLDRDIERPAGDDAPIPIEETVIQATEKRIVTTRTEFEPPSADQLLAKEKTDSGGLVRFRLSPGKVRTTAGTLVTHTTIDKLDTGVTETRTSRTPIAEPRPDIYFRAHTPGGGVIDTRFIASGFIVNLRSRRVGSPDAPLVFEFGGGPVIARD
jgi:hypothetical protein